MDNNVVAKHILDVAAKIRLEKTEKKEFVSELSDIFNSATNLDLNSRENLASLKALAEAFEAVFTKAGKNFDLASLIKMPPSDMFAEMGKIAATSFWDAWNSVSGGMSGNTTKEMMREQFKQLEAQKADLIKRQKSLPKRLKDYKELSSVIEDLPYMETNAFEAFNKKEIDNMKKELGASIEKIADDMQEALRRATNTLSKMSLEDPNYDNALEDAVQKARNVFRMSRTIEENPSIIKNEEILEEYDFSYLQEDYEEFFENLSVRFDGIVKRAVIDLESIPSKLKDIDNQLSQLQNSGIEIIDQDEAKNGLKTLNEIKDAYQEILTADKKRADKEKSKSLLNAIEYNPEEHNIGIKSLYDQYLNAASSGNWVEEYKALLKFIRTYEKFSKDGQKHNSMNMPEIRKLFEQTQHMEKNIANMLQSVYNMAHHLPPVGMGGAEENGSGDGANEATNAERAAEAKRVAAEKDAEAKRDTETKAEAERKAAEELERQAQIEKEKAEAINQQRIEEAKLAKATEEKVAYEEKAKALILEQKEILAEMLRMSNEAGLFFDSKTGNASDIVEGGAHSVETTLGAWKQAAIEFDTRMHSHNYDIAAPSISGKENDFNVWIKGFDYIKKQAILANKEILAFDFSLLESVDVLKEIAAKYREAAAPILEKFNPRHNMKAIEEYGGIQKFMEAEQVELRNVLESIMTQYPGVMKSYQLSPDIIAMSKDANFKGGGTGSYKDQVEPIKRETNAHRENTEAIKEETLAQDKLNSVKNQDVDDNADTNPLVEKYNQASDTVKQLTDKLAYLDQQMQTLDERTSAVNMDGFDQWNPTDEQKNHIVKTLGEYQNIIKQIADFPIVQTDDDKKRLIELKEEALKLANTLKLAYRSDSNPDSYIKEYGVSREQARIFMDIQHESSKLRTEIRSELNNEFNTTFAKIQETDKEFARTILDNADNLNQLVNGVTAVVHEVNGLNESLEKTQQLASRNGIGGGTGDVSTSEFEAEREKTESLQNELEQKNSALNAANEEKQTIQNDLDIVNKQNAELRERLSNDGDALFTAEQRANEAEERANQLERKLAESLDGDKKQGSVNAEELKTLLGSIVHNVKIVHDDNDKTANKIEINESTLEATLTKVFANILNPQTQQNDSEQRQEPWALENTLKTVKGVLGNIQTNTAKIGAVETSNVDTIAGTALDSRLSEIKSVLESINQKIVDGGKIFNRDGAKQAYKEVQDSGPKQTSQSNMFKSLQKDYESMGKLSAQFAAEENLETKAMLENLKQTIARKREELKLTMEQNAALRQKYSIAFDAEKRLLDAAKAQEKIDKQNRQDGADEKTAWKKKVKDAQRETGINAADSVYRATNYTVIRAIGTESISSDIEAKAKELAEQNKILNNLRNSINEKGVKASEQDRDDLSKQISKVKELKTEVDGYLKIHEKYSGDNVTDLGDASNFGAVGTDQYWNNITAAIKNASSGRVTIKGMNTDTGELTGTTKMAANTFAEWSATVDPVTGKLSMLRTGIKKTETIIEQITRKTKEIFTYFSGSSIIFKAVNELKKGIQYVREIDLALTELKKVTDETEETYDQFLKTAAKTGERLGATISAVTEATSTFAKLGYSMEQATEMAEAAIVYKNVGDNIANTEDAADSIISTMKGFKLEASEAMRIVDSFNEVGNRFAITSKGIGEALRLSASALSEGGNSLDESIGLITAANEVVNDPSSVGTALKTLTLRLRGSKTELEEMGEDVTDMATTTSQLQSKLLALTGGKVDIMLDANTFKNSTQILREMAAAWEDMNDIQRASALELMGGKRQANVLSALISNFDTVESAIETSANSAGSALKENERYLDSIQGKIDQFTNATQAMWSNTLNSDWIKGFINIGTILVQLIDKVGLLQSALLGLFMTISIKRKQSSNELLGDLLKDVATRAKAVVYGSNTVKEETGASATDIETESIKRNTVEKQKNAEATATVSVVEDKNTSDKLEGASATDIETSNIKENTAANIENANSSQVASAAEDKDTQDTLENIGATKTDTNTTKENTAANIENANSSQVAAKGEQVDTNATNANIVATAKDSNITKTTKAMSGLSTAIGLVTTAGKGLLKVVGGFLKSNWVILVITLLPSIISWLANLESAEERLAKQISELEEEWKSLSSTVNESVRSFTSLKKEANDIIPKYAKLSQGVDEFGKNISLTDKEYEEFISLNNRLGEMFPDLISGYDSSGNAMLKLAGDASTLTESLEDLIEVQRLATAEEVADTMPDIVDNITKQTKAYDQQNENLKTQYNAAIAAQEKIQGLYSEEVKQIYQDTYGENWKNTLDSIVDQVDITNLQHIFKTSEAWVNAIADYVSEDNKIDWASFVNGPELANALAGVNKQINDNVNRGKQKWGRLNPILSQWALTDVDYQLLDDNAQNIVQKIVGAIDFSTLDLDTAEEVQAYVKDNIITPIYNSTPEAREAMASLLTTQNAFDSGKLSIATYEAEIDNLITKLKELNVSDDIIKTITAIFNTDDLASKKSVAHKLLDFNGDTRIKEFTKSDLDIINEYASEWKIDDNTIYSWDELRKKIDEVKQEVWSAPVEFDEVSNGLDAIQNAYTSLSDAIEQYNNTGYLTLDSLQAILSLEPEYLALLQIENGQLSINQAAAEAMIQTKLAEAEANAIQSAMTQLETLAKEAATKATNDNATAATNAITSLGNYSSALGTVAQDAIVAAGAVSALNNAVDGAKEAGVSEKDINAVMSNLNTYLSLIDTTRQNLSSSFVPIVTGGTGGNPEAEHKDDAFQREMDYWENRIAANQAKYEQLQNEIDLLEKKGQKADASYYEEQIKLTEERRKLLEGEDGKGGQKGAALAYLKELEDAGKEGSEEWWEVANTLNDIESELDDVTSSIVDLQDAIAEIDTYKFEEFNTRLDNLTSKLETIRNLIAPDEEDWFDDNGDWTEEGVAVLGSRIQELEMYKQGYQETMDELAKYESPYADNEEYYASLGIHSEQEWYDKTEELISQQYDFAESINDTEQSIVDMYESSIDAVEEYVDTLIDGYNDYIDSVKEALSAERD